MILEKSEIDGIKFYYRPGFSDKKTFNEVIGQKIYLKKGMTINKNENWMDCGGNVGAFTLLACSKKAKVTVYEPDLFNCKMIEKNLNLNGFNAEIKQAALVHDYQKEIKLFIGNNNNTWRNSIVKKWNKNFLKVKALNFDEESINFDYCKMDIEGAEFLILENTNKVFKKLVYEWSFDIDPSLERFWNIIDKQKEFYDIADFRNKARIITRDYNVWQKNWFPACLNIFCYEKNRIKTN